MSWAPRSKAVDRDWGDDTTGCNILHVDMDAFFASLEEARHPEYAGRPIIVGGMGSSADIHGVVATASYAARKYGVHSAMPIVRARRLCPNGVYIPADHRYYSRISHEIFGGIVASVTDKIEQISVDEAYVDVSGALLRWKSPVAIGQWIRREVFRRFRITCSVGIGSNKLIAKLASTNAKPNGLLLVPKACNARFVQMLPVAALNGVGPATAERLRQWGIQSVRDLTALSRSDLTRAVRSQAIADWLYAAARGEGSAEIATRREEKSVSVERTYPSDLIREDDVNRKILSEADEVAGTLRAKGLVCRTVGLKLRFDDLKYVTRSKTLEVPTDQASVISPVARSLFAAYLRSRRGKADEVEEASGSSAQDVTSATTGMELPFSVRLVGVSASGLSSASTTSIQPTLFDTGADEDPSSGEAPSSTGVEARQKASAAEQALDSVRRRFGSGAARLGL